MKLTHSWLKETSQVSNNCNKNEVQNEPKVSKVLFAVLKLADLADKN